MRPDRLGVIYCRISPRSAESKKKSRQRAENTGNDILTSLEVQASLLKQDAARLGYSVLASFDDVYKSGKSRKGRDGLASALRACKVNKATLFVYELSRLSRGGLVDTFQTIDELTKTGCQVFSHKENIDTSTAMGRAFVGFMAIINQLHRELTAERVSVAMLYYQNEEGLAMGSRVPFGRRRVGARLEDDPGELEVIELVCRWYVMGMRMRGICRRLAEEGFRPRAGSGGWSHTLIRLILERRGVKIRPRKKDRPGPTVTPTEGEIVEPGEPGEDENRHILSESPKIP